MFGPGLRRMGVQTMIAMSMGHEAGWAMTPGLRWALHRIGDSVDRVTYLTEYTRSKIAPALSTTAAAGMRQLPPGVDTALFNPAQRSAASDLRREFGIGDRPVIVCVSRLMKRKGQDRLIDAMPAISAAVLDLHDWIEISEEKFWQVANSYRGTMWRQGNDGAWKLNDPIWEREPVDERVDHGGRQQRLVTLHVDHDVAVHAARDLGNAVGAGAMRRVGQAHHAAEGGHRVGNAGVVGGHHHGIHAGRVGRTSIDVLDHRAAGNLDERFPRQTRGVVSSRDDGDDRRRETRAVEGIAESDRVHGES